MSHLSIFMQKKKRLIICVRIGQEIKYVVIIFVILGDANNLEKRILQKRRELTI